MSFININLKLDETEFPILHNLKKKDFDKLIFKIFKTGYDIYFPPQDKIIQQIEYNELLHKLDSIKHELKDELINSEFTNKVDSLEANLSKLIGLSANSCKKGNFGENILEEIFQKRYGDIKFERKSQVPHSGDAWLYLHDNQVIMLESKNYTSTVNKDEIIKLQSDMISQHINWGIFVSFNSMIQGMKELDFHTFTHNNENYYVIMISNLALDYHKLDLGLQIIRKLITNLTNLGKFPWIVNDINQSLIELNQIIQKNYHLRDAYYNMEKDIQKMLSNYHIILRDYQYDIEHKINEICHKIQTTMDQSIELKENNYSDLLNKYQDSKMLVILSRFIDIINNKKWIMSYDEATNNWLFSDKEKEIAKVKIQAKKIIINIIENDLIINLHLGKDKENKQNLELIKLL